MAFDDRELRRRAGRLRLVLTDNDGVLTDSGVFFTERGEVMKRYSIRDGMGVVRLRAAGIETAIVTREERGSIGGRAKKLGARLYRGVDDKLRALPAILADAQVSLAEVAYIGDDVNDLEALRHVAAEGLTGAPLDAMPEVASAAHYRCVFAGGQGAFRDFAEWLLKLRG